MSGSDAPKALRDRSRIARVRALDERRVRDLVSRNIERPLLGFLGEDRINVLALNRQLDLLGGGAR